jgi:hypothetical protein
MDLNESSERLEWSEPPKLQTGDLLLCGGNRGSGFLVRIGTTSVFTHVGIAVWRQEERIVLDGSNPSAELWIFEMSREPRYDPVVKREISGAGLTRYLDVVDYYSIIEYRPLAYRPDQFLERFHAIIERYYGAPFQEDMLAFIGAWLQVDPLNRDQRFPKFICTELTYQIYGEVFSCKLPLGPETPWSSSIITPEMFTPRRSFRSPLFQNRTYEYKAPEATVSESLLGPLLLGIGVVGLLVLVFKLVKPASQTNIIEAAESEPSEKKSVA